MHFWGNLGHFRRHHAVKCKRKHAPSFKACSKSSHPAVEKKWSLHKVHADVFKSLTGFHTLSPTFHVCHTWECWRHDVNDNYDGGVYLPAEVREKNEMAQTGLNECSVGRCRDRTWARKREGVWKMESGGEGWIVLCAGKEKRERLLWYVYMSVCPRSHWSNLCMWVYTLKSLASSFPKVNETFIPSVSTTIMCYWM